MSSKISLAVPYYSQRDNKKEWWRTCSTSSHAMVLKFLKPNSINSDDEYFEKHVQPYGDSTDWKVHSLAFQRFGIQSEFRTNLDFDDLRQSLKRGRPIIIGVLHRGPVSAPSGGHVIVIMGMDEARGVFYSNDPWGEGFSYENTNGKNVEYPINPSLNRRWLVDGPGSGWGRIILN
jgi:uncharacterized protein YvpB